MTVLTKAMREDVLEGVPTDSFRERFNAVAVALTGHVKKRVQEGHPVFCHLAKDAVSRSYLAISFSPTVYRAFEGGKAKYFQPEYGEAAETPRYTWARHTERVHNLPIKDVEGPAVLGDTVVPEDHQINADYLKAWEDYTAAQIKLNALLHSYKSREKFEADFPAFAKYLPARVFTAPLPMVIVRDVLEGLAEVGVPAK